MGKHSKYSIKVAVGLAALAIVFGLAVLMIVERYDPSVITSVVTGTSLAAAELVRQLQTSAPPPSELPEERP